MAPTLEVAGIFRRHGEAFRQAHAGHLSYVERRIMGAITACRTAALGGHVEQCDDCGATRIAYNSCRNRHCPKCQSLARAQWLAQRQIAGLYAIEKDIRGRGVDERRTVRQDRSRPIIDDLERWLRAKLALISQKPKLAEAIRYALSRWDGLTRFLDDGRIEIDSNVVERSIRPIARNLKTPGEDLLQVHSVEAAGRSDR